MRVRREKGKLIVDFCSLFSYGMHKSLFHLKHLIENEPSVTVFHIYNMLSVYIFTGDGSTLRTDARMQVASCVGDLGT